MAFSFSARKGGSKITFHLTVNHMVSFLLFKLPSDMFLAYEAYSKIKPKIKEHNLLASISSLYLEPHFTFAKSLHCFCDPDHDDDGDAVSDQAQTLSSHVARSHDGDGPRTGHLPARIRKGEDETQGKK